MIGRTVGHYRILRRLGAGGMGVVFEAEDTALGRVVALKFLSKDLTEDEVARTRFINEARAAARIDHTNICTVHEIGETEDHQVFIAMSRYEGESLKERLARGPLDESAAVDVVSQVLRGLSAAHDAGIVHRDVKPSNVILTSTGLVKLIDFGVAKLSGVSVTRSRSSVGTTWYMAPEQLGGREITPATDLWAVGVLLYEMLAGRRPFDAEYVQATMYMILNEEPEPLVSHREDATPGMQRVVSCLLRKSPSERYSSASEALAALDASRGLIADVAETGTIAATKRKTSRGLVLSALLALLVVVVGLYSFLASRTVPQAPSTTPTIRSLAVLPFANLSGDEDKIYLVDGLHDAIVSEIAGLGSIGVTSRRSVMRYRGTTTPLPDVARELGVDAIVEGSVMVDGERVSITAQLIDGRTDLHLWRQTFERTSSDLIRLRSDIASSIAGQLRLALTPEEERRLESAEVVDPEAYNLYLRGRHHLLQYSPPSTRLAIESLQGALDVDPTYAPAWGSLARAEISAGAWIAGTAEEPAGCWDRAERAARRAIAINPDEPSAINALGLAHMQQWRWTEAETALVRAIELEPHNSMFRVNYANYLTWIGRFAEAEAVAGEAIRIDPLSPFALTELAHVHFHEGLKDKAVSEMRDVMEIEPNFLLGRIVLASMLADTGRGEEGVAIVEEIVHDYPGIPDVFHYASRVHDLAGNPDRAREYARRLVQSSGTIYVSPVALAEAFLRLGRPDAALDQLERGIDVRDSRMIQLGLIQHSPPLTLIRDHPRFRAVMERIAIPGTGQTASS